MQSTKPNSVNRQSWNVKVEVERWKIWRESRDMEYFVLHPSQFHFSQSISFMGSVDSLLEIAAIRYNSDLFSCSQSKTGRGLVVVFIYSISSILGKNVKIRNLESHWELDVSHCQAQWESFGKLSSEIKKNWNDKSNVVRRCGPGGEQIWKIFQFDS